MRLRFGIGTLMGFIVFAAIAFAALRSSSDLWPSAIFTVTVVVLSIAVLGAMASRGRTRLTWAGLAVFGWVYLIIAFGPWPANVDGPPPLLTLPLLDAIQDYVFSDGKTPYLTDDYQGPYRWVQEIRGDPAVGAIGPLPGGYKTVKLTIYRQTGHSLAAIIFAFIGAVVGRFFAARSERSVRRPE